MAKSKAVHVKGKVMDSMGIIGGGNPALNYNQTGRDKTLEFSKTAGKKNLKEKNIKKMLGKYLKKTGQIG